MDKFIKHEEWEDYEWCFMLSEESDYSTFKKLNYSSWDKRVNLRTILESRKDVKQPSEQQIKTFEFIEKNQKAIVSSIFDYYLKIIYPYYKEEIDIEEEEIVNSIVQLNRVFGIEKVEIPLLNKQKSTYFLIRFDFRYDAEHGLYILFENDSPIDHFGRGDRSYNAIKIYDDGLENENGEPLKFNISYTSGEPLHSGSAFFDEEIEITLEKGVYEAHIYCGRQFSFMFYVPTELEKFSLKQIAKMK